MDNSQITSTQVLLSEQPTLVMDNQPVQQIIYQQPQQVQSDGQTQYIIQEEDLQGELLSGQTSTQQVCHIIIITHIKIRQ